MNHLTKQPNQKSMKLSKLTRVLIGLSSVLMVATFFLPLWQIQLWAPQYPEGLNMKIWHNQLSGAFDIINGLNHYIGMREIKAEMFPELRFIGYLLGIFIAIGLTTALLGSRRWLLVFVSTAFLYGGAALWDFWRWGYDYGHNLNPHAAIVVPGMAYQPPVIGYKNLLNFTAYSGPDTGGWLIIGISILATFLLFYEYFLDKKRQKRHLGSKEAMAVLLFAVLLFGNCTSGPEPIRYGSDACAFCKMTLSDQRFGAELITQKGKVFKFDDLNCLGSYLHSGVVERPETAQLLAVDFVAKGQFIPVEKGFFLQHEAIKSPMRSDIAAFSSRDEREKVKTQLGGGKEMDWTAVLSSH